MEQSIRIKFYCRSFSKELYTLSSRLYEAAGYPCVRLTDQTADGYFVTMLSDLDCDVAINVDEDCFITDLDAVLALAEKVVAEQWVNIGCSDDGVGCPRGGHPLVTNPFFNVFNLRLIRTRWQGKQTLAEIQKFDFAAHRDELRAHFDSLSLSREMFRDRLFFDNADNEPYYNFFFWLVLQFPGQTHYLDNCKHTDGVTTSLYFCLHTWFARFYHPFRITYLFEGNNLGIDHERRIDAIIDEAYAARHLSRPQFGSTDRMNFFFDGLQRWSVKIPQRIANWPNKLRRRFS